MMSLSLTCQQDEGLRFLFSKAQIIDGEQSVPWCAVAHFADCELVGTADSRRLYAQLILADCRYSRSMHTVGAADACRL